MKISAMTGTTMLDALKAQCNSGTLVIYSGTAPTNPDTALSGNTILSTFTFVASAFGTDTAAGGYESTTATFVANTVTAVATGTATFARVFKSDGSSVVTDLTVGTSAADIILNSTAITSGGNVTLTSFQLKMPID